MIARAAGGWTCSKRTVRVKPNLAQGRRQNAACLFSSGSTFSAQMTVLKGSVIRDVPAGNISASIPAQESSDFSDGHEVMVGQARW